MLNYFYIVKLNAAFLSNLLADKATATAKLSAYSDYFKTHAERISKANVFPEYFPSGEDYNELLEHCKYEFNNSRSILTFYSKNNHSYLEFPILKYRKNIYSAQYIAKNFTVLSILESELKVIKVSNWQISPYYIKLIKHG